MKNKKTNSEKKSGGFKRGVNSVLSGSFLAREYVQANIPFVLFLTGMMVCYIGYGYFAESNMKELVQAETELLELKSRNLSISAKLEQLKQQSAVAQAIEKMGLKESTDPPSILRVTHLENAGTE